MADHKAHKGDRRFITKSEEKVSQLNLVGVGNSFGVWDIYFILRGH